MRLPYSLLIFLLTYELAFAARPLKCSYSSHDYYVLHHDPTSGASLAEVAAELGVQLVDQAGELKDHWVVRSPKQDGAIQGRVGDPALEALRNLQRRASSSHSARSDVAQHARKVTSSIKYLSRQEPRQRTKRAPPPIRPGDDDSDSSEAEHPSSVIAQRLGITDPLFGDQWHIVNNEFPQHMMNVTPLWEMGITGQGVISALVDDGLDYSSDDLADNFWPSGSYDYNDHEDLPTPKLADDHHGTRCAGQIAAVKNNVCGMGIAYESKIAGIRILSGAISDLDEAAALNFDYQNTSIYSCSWGPTDDGRTMEAPGHLIQRAFINGIENGRDGKGSVFVFASGNGAASGDQCNFDGYTNSIFSVTVAAIDFKGLHPVYSEACAANLVVTYSSGGGLSIATTDLGKDKCTKGHGGTSAAAPNAVGVYALALSVRPDLTWRDIQHLSVNAAEIINPEDPDWEMTAAGRRFSYKYGYGKLDGYKFVTAAQNWELVKPQAWVEIPPVQVGGGTCDLEGVMEGGELIVPAGVTSSIQVTSDLLRSHNVEKLEHVTVRVWITHTRRGDVEVELMSPNGIKSVLAARRPYDAASSGYPGWRFMSVKHWDEDPIGNWTIRVSDNGTEGHVGHFLGWGISLWGSAIVPAITRVHEISPLETLLPAASSTNNSSNDGATTTSKFHPKPTANLPGDHGTAEGEADKPAFSDGKPVDDAADPSAALPSPSSSLSPTADEGWFAAMSNLVSHQRWFFVAAGAVILFGLGMGLIFWRRRRAANQGHNSAGDVRYTSLPDGEDVAMSSIVRDRPRTKELYDAFGEVSDDEDADEETSLRPGGTLGRPEALGFHSGFLDDEDPRTATRASGLQSGYRDEPDAAGQRGSPSGSGSVDGSWEHASQTR